MSSTVVLENSNQNGTLSKGSGFFISHDGYIATNAHVVDILGEGGEVVVKTYDPNKRNGVGQSHKGRVIGWDERTDVALVKIDGLYNSVNCISTSPLTFAESQMLEKVYTVGHPTKHSFVFSSGEITKPAFFDTTLLHTNRILSDISVDTGNSGGPLLNENLELIGMNNAFPTSRHGSWEGMTYSIPIETVQHSLRNIFKQQGNPQDGWMGIGVNYQEHPHFNPDARPRIVTVLRQSPAETYGIQRGDFLISYNGAEIADAYDLARAKIKTSPGDVVSLLLERNGSIIAIDLPLADQKAREMQLASHTTTVVRHYPHVSSGPR